MWDLYEVLIVPCANVELTFPIRIVAHYDSPNLVTKAVVHDIPS